MQSSLRRVFKREHILNIVLVVSAFLGIIGNTQAIGLTPEKVIMGLLGALALNNLVVRVGYLERIEHCLTRTEERLNRIEQLGGSPRAQDLLYTREKGPSLREALANPKEVWLTGRSLVNVLDFSNYFEALAKEYGCRFRFLLPDPKEVSGELVYGKRWAKAFDVNIAKVLKNLEELHKAVGKDLVEVRVLKHVPMLGLLLIDVDKPYGRIQVQLYPYDLQGPERPLFDVYPGDDWYALFRDHFDKLWKLAQSYEFDG